MPDDLGPKYAGFYLKDGLSYVKRQKLFAPAEPEALKAGATREVELRVGDDVASAAAAGYEAKVMLRLQADAVPEDLQVELNGAALTRSAPLEGWTECNVQPTAVKLGVNRVLIRRGNAATADTILKDLQLSISYRRKTS